MLTEIGRLLLSTFLWTGSPQMTTAPVRHVAAPSDSICQLERAAARAYVAHDGPFLEMLFADDFHHANFRGGVVDKRGEISFFTSPELQIGGATVDTCTAQLYDRVAVATGVTTWTRVIYKGADLSGQYRYTRVYHEADGRWQVVASHFSKIVPP